jgi:hypothetical protein
MGKKTFYTERDLEDLLQRGVLSLEVHDDIVLTEAAQDLARKRGLRLVRATPHHPADGPRADLIHRVKAAVRARLGDQVDDATLEATIHKILREMKMDDF